MSFYPMHQGNGNWDVIGVAVCPDADEQASVFRLWNTKTRGTGVQVRKKIIYPRVHGAVLELYIVVKRKKRETTDA
jgi:hypothetical protein